MILVHVEWCMHADREKMESAASRSGGAVKYPHPQLQSLMHYECMTPLGKFNSHAIKSSSFIIIRTPYSIR